MEPPILKPSDRAHLSERRHRDPPALWYTVILGSVVIHLCAFGVLRLLLMGGFVGMKSGKELIPIDVIAIAPNTTSANRLAAKTVATPTQKPKTRNNPTQNRKPASSTASATRTVSQQRETKRPPAANPAQNSKKSPTSTSSPPPSGGNGPKTQSNSATGKNIPSATTTPASRPSDSTNSSPSQTPTSSQSGASFSVVPGNLALIRGADMLDPSDPNNNVELATLLDAKKQPSGEDLKQLGMSLDKDLELKVTVVIETDGTAKVISAQEVRGSISPEKAFALANKIIPYWRFKPTTEARKDNQIAANYDLPLTIRPAPN